MRTDRPLNFGVIRFTPCLVLGWGFGVGPVGGSNGAILSWTKFNRYVGFMLMRKEIGHDLKNFLSNYVNEHVYVLGDNFQRARNLQEQKHILTHHSTIRFSYVCSPHTV